MNKKPVYLVILKKLSVDTYANKDQDREDKKLNLGIHLM